MAAPAKKPTRTETSEEIGAVVMFEPAELRRLLEALERVEMGTSSIELKWNGELYLEPDPKHPDLVRMQVRCRVRARTEP